MDDYERTWRQVARSQSWSTILRSRERHASEYYREWYDRDWQLRNAERRARAQFMQTFYESLEPVRDWVGACWLAPDGTTYPVPFGNHCDRARKIARHLGITVPAYRSPDSYLCERKWLRIGTDGKVTDAGWNRADDWTDEQESVITTMHGKAQTGQHYNKTIDPYFADELGESIKFAYGVLEEMYA